MADYALKLTEAGSVPAAHAAIEHAVISDEEILSRFVTAEMRRYFAAKMPDLPASVLRRRICELLKYLILVRFAPGRIMFGREVDEVWHAWILQTRQYAELCRKLPGNAFRHHSSDDYREGEAEAEATDLAHAVQRILSFFISYYRTFGPLTHDRLACWPTLQRVKLEADWSLDDLNGFLAERAGASCCATLDLEATPRAA